MSMNDKWKLVSRQRYIESDRESGILRETHEMKFGVGQLVRETFYALDPDKSTSVSIVFVPGAI